MPSTLPEGSRSRPLATTVAVAVAVLSWVALSLGGCAPSDGGEASGAGESDAGESPSSALTSRDYAPGGHLGPLEEILGWQGVNPTPQDVIDEIRRSENAVAACMRTEGFRYTPHVPQLSDLEVLPEDPPRRSPEFVAQWGYGSFTQPDENTQGGIRVNGTEGQGWSNDVEQMSEAEQEEFFTALLGPFTATDDDGGTVREGGCVAASGPLESQDDDVAAIRDAAVAYLESMPGNAELDALNQEWSACMRDGGRVEASPMLAERRFNDALLAHIATATGDPWGSEEAKALAAEEIEVATADVACRGETDYVARFNEIDLRLQTEYVEANRADLDALAAAAAGVEG